MKKTISLLMLSLILFSLFSVNLAFAESGSNKDNSAEDDDSIEVEDDDSDDNSVEIEEEISENGERIKEEYKYEYKDSNGTKIKIEYKYETKENGENRKKIKIESEDESEDNEFESELEIEMENNGTKLKLKEKNKTLLLPSQISETIRVKLEAHNYTILLKEKNYSNIPKVVYLIEENKTGKFLGIFKMKYKLEGSIDAETGELIEKNTPWWATLIFGENQEDDNPSEDDLNETVNNTMPIINETIVINETQ